ncbi:MAG: hypothetical protein U0L05_08880 [Schaedlerella sp.]|nr:hypothetical protein [Schaedlerella sp.]
MPGYILHLAAAKILLDKYNISVNKNNFYVGTLLPDAVSEKSASHFRAKERSGKMVEYPELDVFSEKYGSLFNDSSVLGYYYHLYIDRKFFTEYYPRVLKYLNWKLEEETEKEKVVYACVLRTGEILPLKKFLSEEYYYGDFTRMNTWLVEKFQLPLHLNTQIKNPGIKEVDYRNVESVLGQLQGYLEVPAEEAEHLRVFDKEDLIKFLENAAAEWCRMVKY